MYVCMYVCLKESERERELYKMLMYSNVENKLIFIMYIKSRGILRVKGCSLQITLLWKMIEYIKKTPKTIVQSLFKA